MKKLTKMLVCLLLCVFGFGLVACGDPRTEKEKNFTYPSSNDSVYGNGGLAVKKGDYVYFVNGYKSVGDATKKSAKYTHGALMLMKLDKDGNVVRDENGLLDDDYYITMNNKLCGYEATNLFISGSYLYFATPSLENESGDKVWAKERVVIKRIKLDKSSDVEEVYSSGVKIDSFEYQYYEKNGKPYILAWEKGKSYYEENGTDVLVRVDLEDKSSKVVAKNVQDVVFAKNYDQIFFKKHESDDDYYFLKQYNVASNDVTNYATFEKTFDILDVQNNQVFISIAHEYGSSTDIQASTIGAQSAFVDLYAYTSADSVNITEDGHVVLISKNVITLVKSSDEVVQIVDDSKVTSINVIDYTNGSILYYDKTNDGSNIKLVSYSQALNGQEFNIETLTTITAVQEDTAFFDLNEEENVLYFYNVAGSKATNYYLHRLVLDHDAETAEEMFGVYDSDDVPEKQEVEEEIEEE